MGHSLTTPSIAWIAGFFDGDGCVTLLKKPRDGGHGYVPHMALGQSDRTILEAVQRVIGCGTIHEVRKSALSRKTPYSLHWAGENFMVASKRLMSQLVIKREEVLLVRGFAQKWANVRPGTTHLKQSRDQHADQVRHQLQVLKGTLKQ